MSLTPTQILAAAELLKDRPIVMEGTRVILDNRARSQFYAKVRAVMAVTKVADRDVGAFCDRAGVPD